MRLVFGWLHRLVLRRPDSTGTVASNGPHIFAAAAFNARVIPIVAYTDPDVAVVGLI